jgi:peptide/nickel transport system substrate-binding protein/oligopeptide transport system substrate-binding protein
MRKSLCTLSLVFAFACAASAVEQIPFTVGLSDIEINFDPHHSTSIVEAQLFTGIYEGLFTYNPETLLDPKTMQPELGACESYTVSADGKVYTFTIRADARWSTGEALKASHFTEAWFRLIDPVEKGEYAPFFDIVKGAKRYRNQLATSRSEVGIKALSDRVIELRLDSPAPYLPSLLSHHAFSPVHPLMKARKWTDPLRIPCNGPYYIAEASASGYVFKKNSHYWDEKSVKLPSINVRIFDDAKTATSLFNMGDVHWLFSGIDSASIMDYSSIQLNALFGTHYLYFVCKDKPWNDARVRRALALLMPWDILRSSDRYTSPADSLIIKGLPNYPAARSIKKADKAEALKLLSEAGYPEGKGLPPMRVMLSDGEDNQLIAESIKKSLEGVLPGFTVNIELYGGVDYFKRVKTPDYTIGMYGWIGDFLDPLAFLQLFVSDSGLNDAWYSNPDYDALIEQSNGQERNKRYESLSKAESMLLESAAVMPISHSIAFSLIDVAAFKGWFPNILDIHPFKSIEFVGYPAVPGII